MPNSRFIYIYIYIYIEYVIGLVGFYGISTLAGYLMPNSVYTYTHTHTHTYIYIYMYTYIYDL